MLRAAAAAGRLLHHITCCPFQQCLRQLTDHASSLPSSRLRTSFTMWTQQASSGKAYKGYFTAITDRAADLAWVVVIFLVSELLIWVLHMALAPVGLQFLSSIMGMITLFLVMELMSKCLTGMDQFYTERIKPKVDFLNKNMGLGFAVPLVAIDNRDSLGGESIGKVIGTFITTNAIFWILAFVIALGLVVAAMAILRPRYLRKPTPAFDDVKGMSHWVLEEPPRLEFPAPIYGRRLSDAMTLQGSSIWSNEREATLCPNSRAVSVYMSDGECPTPKPFLEPSKHVLSTVARLPEAPVHTGPSFMETCYPILLSVFCIITLGIPVSLLAGDDRVLDGCMLWFVWITSTRLQRTLATHCLSLQPTNSTAMASAKRTLTTLMNPVMLTTLAMTAYTRAKSSATATPLTETLGNFSSGTSLADLWSFLASPAAYPLKPNHAAYFGAGDAALAVLEVGIVVWGFKLHECRRQLASRAGLSVVIASACAAAINVFVSSLLGRGFGLAAPEAMAFAARSTTLALARPAVEALGGNQVVNAALVVSNGILGQVLYPFVLARLGLDQTTGSVEDAAEERDEPRVIAAGTSIGINGAAMGVAYLYERKNKAAPYAALSMTVFGVMTVVFTAVEPFTTTMALLMR